MRSSSAVTSGRRPPFLLAEASSAQVKSLRSGVGVLGMMRSIVGEGGGEEEITLAMMLVKVVLTTSL